MGITLIILALSAFFFVNGKIRSDVVALCALVLLILCGILTPEEALSGFSNSIVIMMVGLFVVGGAIFQTGLAKMISSKILQLIHHRHPSHTTVTGVLQIRGSCGLPHDTGCRLLFLPKCRNKRHSIPIAGTKRLSRTR